MRCDRSFYYYLVVFRYVNTKRRLNNNHYGSIQKVKEETYFLFYSDLFTGTLTVRQIIGKRA